MEKMMGLDISVYSKMVQAEGNEAFDDEGELKYEDNWVKVYANPDFEGREFPLANRKAYKHDVDAEHDVNISMGYGRYNSWRERLAELAGYPKASYESYGETQYRHDAGAWEVTAGPFWELICFSDCEGWIGSFVAQKLAKDFAEYQDKVDLLVDEDNFVRVYNEFRKAFEIASDNGGVQFH